MIHRVFSIRCLKEIIFSQSNFVNSLDKYNRPQQSAILNSPSDSKTPTVNNP